MSVNVANFPGTTWDGTYPTRADRSIDRPPSNEDWDQIVAELLATQVYVAAIAADTPDARLDAIELIVVAPGSVVLPNAAAPTVAANTFAMYATDQVAGNSAPHFKTEAGQIVKLFSAANVADPAGGVTQDAEARTAINAIFDLLEANGLMLPA